MTTTEHAIKDPSLRWWSTTPVGWADVSESLYARWRHHGNSEPWLEKDVVEGAMAFGYGSRTAYGELLPWKELESQLEADWKESGREPEHAWRNVFHAIKFGWSAAKPRQENP
jgi:hypothetical protein